MRMIGLSGRFVPELFFKYIRLLNTWPQMKYICYDAHFFFFLALFGEL